MLKRMIHRWLPATASAVVMTLAACNNQPAPAGKEPLVVENPAIQALKEEIRHYPDSTLLYDKLVEAYTREQQYDQAVAWTDSVINRNPDQHFLYWMTKGDLQRQGGAYDAAIYSYNQYLQRYPDDEQVLLNLANAYAEAGRPQTLQLTRQIVDAFPTVQNRTDAFFINGIYYSRNRHYDSAIASYDQAILNQNTFWEAHLEKGIAYFDGGKYDQAMMTFRQLQQANPSFPDAYYWLGKCHEMKQNAVEALRNYQMAYGLDKHFADAKRKIDSLQQQNVKLE